jgi:hypothetical protein
MLMKLLSLGFILKKSFSLYFLDSTNILKTQITFGRYLKMTKNY